MPPLAGTRSFLGDFVADALPRFLVLVLPPLLLLALLLIVFDVLGRSLGLSKLFWHRKRRLQLEHGVLCALVAAHVSYVSFLLDYDVWLTQSIVAETSATDPLDPYSDLSWLQRKLLESTDRLRIDRAEPGPKLPPPFTWAASEDRPWVASDPRPDARSRFDAWDDSLAYFYYHCGMLACIALVIGAAILLQTLIAGVGTTRPKSVRGFAYGESRIWLPIGFVAGTAGLLAVSRVWGGASDWILRQTGGALTRTTHLSAAVVASVVGGTLLFLRTGYARRRIQVSPATSICLCLSFTAAVFGFFVYHVRLVDVPSFGLIAFAVLAGLLVLSAWRNPFRYRLAFLERRYATPVAIAGEPAGSERPKSPLTFEQLTGPRSRRPADLHVVLCASGGGITAAAWAVETLTRLEAELARRGVDLARCTRLVCGASGGMLGAAHWATARDEDGPTLTPDELRESITRDTLSDVTRHLVTYDLPQLLLPFAHGEDRGTVQEASWLRCYGEHLRVTLDELHAGERDGWRPPLAFTPTLLEEGRRLVISNVDFEEVTSNRLATGHEDDSGLDASGIDLRRLFPAEAGSVSVACAARMNASFPFVSPAASLPTRPPLRVGDAGYYDNWGVSLATSWLRHHLDQLPRDSHVVLLELDAYPKSARQARAIRRRRGEDEEPRPRASALVGVLARTLEDLQAPLIGALSARAAASRLRNDELLEGLAESMDRHGRRFTYVPLVNTFPASLSWILTQAEVDALREEAGRAVDEARELLDALAHAGPHPVAAENAPRGSPPKGR